MSQLFTFSVRNMCGWGKKIPRKHITCLRLLFEGSLGKKLVIFPFMICVGIDAYHPSYAGSIK
jgi:hypothetical protein